MKARYRRFARAGLPSAQTPKITIQTGGPISFNWFAYAALHQPRLVRLTFDEQNRIIKIAAARVEDEYTIPVRTEGRGGTHVIAGKTFAQTFGIDISTARQYEATVEQGKLYVDLKQESKLVGKQKKAAEPVSISAAPLLEEHPPEPEQLVEASVSTAPAKEQPLPSSPVAPRLEGLMEALLPMVEW